MVPEEVEEVMEELFARLEKAGEGELAETLRDGRARGDLPTIAGEDRPGATYAQALALVPKLRAEGKHALAHQLMDAMFQNLLVRANIDVWFKQLLARLEEAGEGELAETLRDALAGYDLIGAMDAATQALRPLLWAKGKHALADELTDEILGDIPSWGKEMLRDIWARRKRSK